MGRMMDKAGGKAHERTITVSTYSSEGDRVVVEGTLVDRRLMDYYLVTGERRPAGAIHNMSVRLMIETTGMTIEDVEVDMAEVPREECPEVRESLSVIRGERIAPGFSGRMKSLLGGVRSCTHLLTLLLAMAPAALQGIFSSRASRPVDLEWFIRDDRRVEFFLRTIINTCHVWREDGPSLRTLRGIIDPVRGGSRGDE
jgi:hypothetical protein